MILVLGATGMVGAHLVAKLEARGMALRAGTRGPGSDGPAFGTLPGTRMARVLVDFERPQSFGPALDRVDRVFLIARPGDEHADRLSRPFIDEMKRRGVKHVVNLSAMGADIDDQAPALRAIEQYLEDSGLSFTHLRPNLLMQVFSTQPLLDALKQTQALPVPAGDARVSFVDARDVAAVAEAALLDPKHAGQAYTLTGEEPLHHADVARYLGNATGIPVRYVPTEEAQARASLAGTGATQDRVDRLLAMYRMVHHTARSAASSAIRTVLGRPATRFDQFARDHRCVWA